MEWVDWVEWVDWMEWVDWEEDLEVRIKRGKYKSNVF